MLAAGGDFQKRRLSTVELPRFIHSGIAASAAAHLSILAAMLVFAEVHPFSSVTAEPIAVDIVTPDEVKDEVKKEEPVSPPKPQPTDVFNFSAKSAPSISSASSAPQEGAVAKPQKQAALAPPPPNQPHAGVELQAPAPSATLPTPSTQFTPAMQSPSTPSAPQTQSTSANPAYVPPEPDVTVKYNVLLGLPPPPPSSGRAFDGVAQDKADVASSLVEDFRRHLRTCSKLPPSIAPSDSVRIKLRVFMTPDGRIAAQPAVVEGSASLKALDLRQSAIDALQACQPYTMLPADRYREWKVLDLNFTPQDFAGAS
jgi:hypothetical protein